MENHLTLDAQDRQRTALVGATGHEPSAQAWAACARGPAGFDRFGGMSVGGGFYGDAVALGNIFGDTSINGGLDGRIAAGGAPDVLGPGRQGLVGNININGGLSSSAARFAAIA